MDAFTITIAGGSTSGTGSFTLTPTDDSLAEGNEALSIEGSAGSLTVTGTSVTIEDDETASTGITLSARSGRGYREDANATAVTVTATLGDAARPSDTAVTVTVGHAGDAAIEGTDYESVSAFTITIAGGSTSGTGSFTLTPTDDEVSEGDETLSIEGSAGVLAVTGTEVTIEDDDAPSTEVRLDVDPREVPEGGGSRNVTLTAELDGSVRPVETEVAVSVGRPGDPAEKGVDYEPVEDFMLTIPEGARRASRDFVFVPVDDAIEEEDETLSVTGENVELAVVPAEVTILANDEPRPETRHYTFRLAENRDGRRRTIFLGSVAVDASDAGAVRYELRSGGAGRFAVDAAGGLVRYVGPGEDYESPPREYTLTIRVVDEAGETHSWASVVVIVTDVPEAPVALDDAVETPEDTPVTIDVLSNDRDPDGGSLRITSFGQPGHGSVRLVSGRLRYTPSPDWHGEDEFGYTVTDRDQATATARVTVTVTPVNDPPVALDDAVETAEDTSVLIDVLSNDSDVDGDRLRVASVSSGAHGTAAVVEDGSWVVYSPEKDWHGVDWFRYTASDPGGLTATALVEVTVLPVNDAPEAVGTIPPQALEEGGDSLELDLTGYFRDADGDALRYTATSSDEEAVRVTVSGARLTLDPVVYGSATVTVTASDPAGLTASLRFGVSVGDRLVREVMTDTMAAMGRGYLSSARLVIGRRLESGGSGSSGLTVAGRQLTRSGLEQMGSGSLEDSHELLFQALALRSAVPSAGVAGTSSDPILWRPARRRDEAAGGGSRFLQGSDLLLSFGGEEGAAPGRAWTLWGRGDLQSFRGAARAASGYDGELKTGYLGADVQWNDRWLFGLGLARSAGAGNWQVGASSGDLTTGLTIVHPYARWSAGKTAVWGLAGLGRGSAENVRALTGRRGASRLGLGLGLLEARRQLAAPRGISVAARAEASWARLRTGSGRETVDRLRAGVTRLRTGLEAARPLSLFRGLRLAPFAAVSARHDGGSGQTGLGLEVAGGLRLTGGRLRLEAQGRTLALHTARAYREHGLSLIATVGAGRRQPGLSASLRPSWGAAGQGADMLWRESLHTSATGRAAGERGLDAELGYGFRLPGGRLLSAFGGYGGTAGGRRFQLGASLGALGGSGRGFDSPVKVEFLGERYLRPGGAADHRFTLFGIINFGQRARRNCPASAPACNAPSAFPTPAPNPREQNVKPAN